MSLSKHWLFTLNNPNNNDIPRAWMEHCDFIVWQLEKGENGTPHLQGYLCLSTKKRLQWLKNNVNEFAHWEVRRGNLKQALDYVQKEDTREAGPWTIGVVPQVGNGRRTDLLTLKRALDSGKSEREIAEADETFPTWLRNYKGIERYKRLRSESQRTWQTTTTVYWGAPGTGKSRRALHEAGPDAYWMRKPSSSGGVYWDGYDGQAHVVIDEFYGWIPRDLMCRICDRYPLLVDTKGGATPFLAKRIWITSNEPPVNWWQRVGLGAMGRRLTGELGIVVPMHGPDVWTPPIVPEEEQAVQDDDNGAAEEVRGRDLGVDSDRSESEELQSDDSLLNFIGGGNDYAEMSDHERLEYYAQGTQSE